MMTGQDPFNTGIIAQGAQVDLPTHIPMIAETLRHHGYFTAAADNLGRWFSRGFNLYEGYQWEITPNQPWRKAEAVNETALRVLSQCAAQPDPFFLFIHYWDCHTPYLPPAPFDRMFYQGSETDTHNSSMDPVWECEAFNHYFAEWLPGVTDIEFPKAQYDAEIAYLDSCLARLFDALSAPRLAEDTCVIITADHGEEMDEHGCWFDHHGLYDTNLHIPLIVRGGNSWPTARRVDGFVRTLDIAPTILDLANLPQTAWPQNMQGRSFRPLLDGTTPPGEGTCSELFLTECTWMRKRGYRNHQYKYIQALEPDLHGKPPEELYDVLTDPGETINLAETRQDLVEPLRSRLASWKAEREAASGRPDPLDGATISLRRIGNSATPIPRRATANE